MREVVAGREPPRGTPLRRLVRFRQFGRGNPVLTRFVSADALSRRDRLDYRGAESPLSQLWQPAGVGLGVFVLLPRARLLGTPGTPELGGVSGPSRRRAAGMDRSTPYQAGLGEVMAGLPCRHSRRDRRSASDRRRRHRRGAARRGIVVRRPPIRRTADHASAPPRPRGNQRAGSGVGAGWESVGRGLAHRTGQRRRAVSRARVPGSGTAAE